VTFRDLQTITEGKNVKKWTTIGLGIMICVCLAACGNDQDRASEDGDNKNAQQKQPETKAQKQPGGDTVVDENADPPKSRIFSSIGGSIGRAFSKKNKGDDANSDSSNNGTPLPNGEETK
jgi:hypothetical protein